MTAGTITLEQLPDRLQAGVRVAPNGCWLWVRARKEGPSTQSYGVVWWHGSKQYAHRVAWTLLHGAVPVGLELDHLCEARPCINPAHMEAVTRKTNLHRSARYWATRKVKKSGAAASKVLEGEARIARRRRSGHQAEGDDPQGGGGP